MTTATLIPRDLARKLALRMVHYRRFWGRITLSCGENLKGNRKTEILSTRKQEKVTCERCRKILGLPPLE